MKKLKLSEEKISEDLANEIRDQNKWRAMLCSQVRRLLTKRIAVFSKSIVNTATTGCSFAQSENVLKFIQKFVRIKSSQNIFEKKKQMVKTHTA